MSIPIILVGGGGNSAFCGGGANVLVLFFAWPSLDSLLVSFVTKSQMSCHSLQSSYSIVISRHNTCNQTPQYLNNT